MIPPAVLPAHEPVNITRTTIVCENSGHLSKSTVENPVVEIIDDTVKAEFLIASPKFPYILYIFIDIQLTAVININKKQRTSQLKDSFIFPVKSKK